MVRPCSENGSGKITQNNTEVDVETKERQKEDPPYISWK